MCTVTWIHGDGGFRLLCNRDERLTRAPARPPERLELAGTSVLAPADGEAGGTWIAANEHGLVLALVNHYQAGHVPEPARARSRGLLVRDLADASAAMEVERRLNELDLAVYPGFRLVVVDGVRAGLFGWDGAALARDDSADPRPVVSSSHARFAEVATVRGALWRERVAHGDAQLDFHASHAPERGVLSVCMHREDARTVSLTEVVVSPSRVAMRYAPDAPCSARLGEALEIERAGS